MKGGWFGKLIVPDQLKNGVAGVVGVGRQQHRFKNVKLSQPKPLHSDKSEGVAGVTAEITKMKPMPSEAITPVTPTKAGGAIMTIEKNICDSKEIESGATPLHLIHWKTDDEVLRELHLAENIMLDFDDEYCWEKLRITQAELAALYPAGDCLPWGKENQSSDYTAMKQAGKDINSAFLANDSKAFKIALGRYHRHTTQIFTSYELEHRQGLGHTATMLERHYLHKIFQKEERFARILFKGVADYDDIILENETLNSCCLQLYQVFKDRTMMVTEIESAIKRYRQVARRVSFQISDYGKGSRVTARKL